MNDIDLMLGRLEERWGYVNVCPWNDGKWCCSSTTDEGLCSKYDFQFIGNSPTHAIYKAYRTIKCGYTDDIQFILVEVQQEE